MTRDIRSNQNLNTNIFFLNLSLRSVRVDVKISVSVPKVTNTKNMEKIGNAQLGSYIREKISIQHQP